MKIRPRSRLAQLSALVLASAWVGVLAGGTANAQPDPAPPTPSTTTGAQSISGGLVVTTRDDDTRTNGGGGGSSGGGSGSSSTGGNDVTTVSTTGPRLTVVITSPTQTPCTLPDGTPGIQIVTAPVRGATFDSVCVRPTDPLPADTVVIQAITIEEAIAATDFPRITAHTNPGPHAGLPGVAYAVHLEGVTQPTIAPSVRGITLHGRGTATSFHVSTDTGSVRGTRDPDGHFTTSTPGSHNQPVGTLVWQTGGMKQLTVVTSWHLEYWMTFPNGTRIDIGQADTTVTDQTPHPIFGLTTQITATE
jgi:hypothetical protein